METFKKMYEAQQWVIYDKDTGKAESKRWGTHKGAKNALTKFTNGVVASAEWYQDNQDDLEALKNNAKGK